MGERERSGVVAHLHTVKVAGDLHDVSGARMSAAVPVSAP
jgi:hypothetical protein